MARPRQPIEMMMGKRRVHRSGDEIKARADNEIKASSDAITAPSFLSGVQKREFGRVSGILKKLRLMTNLDCVSLAQYIVSKDEWIQYSKLLTGVLADCGKGKGGADVNSIADNIVILEKVTGLQDKAFKRCRACAGDLGLTISSRCKLTLPKVEEKNASPYEGLFGDAL